MATDPITALTEQLAELQSKFTKVSKELVSVREAQRAKPFAQDAVPKPEKFSGARGARSISFSKWRFTIQQFVSIKVPALCSANVTPAEHAMGVALVGSYLDGLALEWFRAQFDAAGNCTIPNISTLLTLLQTRFCPVTEPDRLRTKLFAMKQTHSVLQYANSFVGVVNELRTVGALPDDLTLLHLFVQGLKPGPVQQQVMMHKHTYKNIDETFNAALRYADALFVPNTNFASHNSGPAPMELGSVHAGPKRTPPVFRPRSTSEAGPSRPRPFPHAPESSPLTPDEQAHLRHLQETKAKLTDADKTVLSKAKACWYCRKPGHHASACPDKLKKN
jgi:hypothetical protein